MVTSEHLKHIDKFIEDINYIHYDIGLDMSKFNVMFSFDSHKNIEKFGNNILGTEMLTQQQQVEFYRLVSAAFVGTELEEGLKEHWFKEFTPEFCCSAVNCGDKFFLLQSNGDVYACPRGQSSSDFLYGNVFNDPINQILDNGWQTIETIENTLESSEECFTCNYLPHCNQGCVFVRVQTKLTKSYTCLLQKEIYKDNPEKYPLYTNEQIKGYSAKYKYRNSIQSFSAADIEPVKDKFITEELYDDDNALATLIKNDPVLQHIYEDSLFSLMIDGVEFKLTSPILTNSNDLAQITSSSEVVLKVRKNTFELNCKDPVNNVIQMMMLRNTLVVYGDEQRESKSTYLTTQSTKTAL